MRFNIQLKPKKITMSFKVKVIIRSRTGVEQEIEDSVFETERQALDQLNALESAKPGSDGAYDGELLEVVICRIDKTSGKVVSESNFTIS